MRYRIGDELILKIEDDFGYSEKTFRSAKVQVIGYNTDGVGEDAEYLVYVPHYEKMNNTFTLNASHARWYCVDPKFIGDDVAFIASHHPVYNHIPAPQGENCDRCGEFNEGSVRDVNDAYTCRACKFNRFR